MRKLARPHWPLPRPFSLSTSDGWRRCRCLPVWLPAVAAACLAAGVLGLALVRRNANPICIVEDHS